MATTGVMPAVNVGGDVTAAGGAGAAAVGGPISPMATTGVMPAVNVGGDVAAGAAGADAAAGSGADASAGGGECLQTGTTPRVGTDDGARSEIRGRRGADRSCSACQAGGR